MKLNRAGEPWKNAQLIPTRVRFRGKEIILKHEIGSNDRRFAGRQFFLLE